MPHSQFMYLKDIAPVTEWEPRKVVLLADTMHPSHVVLDHIASFARYSPYEIEVVNPRLGSRNNAYLIHDYDALIVHYSLFIISDNYLSGNWRREMRRFKGLKLLTIEDEYQQVNAFRACMKDLGFHIVVSALDSPDTMRAVYGDGELTGVQFYCGLPGYITDAIVDTQQAPPFDERPFDIVYRGRTLPAQLGKLAHEKRSIGDQVKALASQFGLKVDIAADEESRIYGDAWPRFLMSGKAMLGVEGGASMFDFDGSLSVKVKEYEQAHPDAGFDEVWQAVLAPYEGNVMFRTLTPKFFEAIAAHTALVLYPGEYSGVLKPDEHYIVLERDGSNMAQVAERLRDIPALEAMTRRAYEDIISRRDLHMAFYVEQLSAAIEMHMPQLEAAQPQDDTSRLFDGSYDAVVMLSWSDWHTEPRSNRYHYASRFARHVPVLFVQPWGRPEDPILTEKVGMENFTLLHGPSAYTQQNIEWFRAYLRKRGIRRPLFWIYDSLHYDGLLDAFPRAMRVYHATEDYLTTTSGAAMQAIGESVTALLPRIDFMVAVSQGVLDVYRISGHYKGPAIVAENGCDAEYFIGWGKKHPTVAPDEARLVALFQGGINTRLDYELLYRVVESMPDWEFRFCGKAIASDGWEKLAALANVTYLGEVSLEVFTQEMYTATVGIIPFIQDQWIRNSLPLKAYEYIACGLPVVTVPIAALEQEPHFFCSATDAEAFAAAIRAQAGTRRDPAMLEKRRRMARINSYDKRFEEVVEAIAHAMATPSASSGKGRMQILMLYDAVGSMHVSTIREHLEAFGHYSKHTIHYVPATPSFWQCSDRQLRRSVNLDAFDVIIVHYSLRLSVPDHLHTGLADAMAESQSVKVLFIQDEYEGTEIARKWMDRIGFDVVYTCVPPDEVEKVYKSERFPHTRFLPTLTGYVPESEYLESFALPMRQRQLRIGYRGRMLDPIYGMLGYEKYDIGVRMKAEAEVRGIAADIEVSNDKRIYGLDWYRFMGAVRATLGTESGSTIFDDEGAIRAAIGEHLKQHPQATFMELFDAVLEPYEGTVRMNQISPKIFEAVRLRTALVLFEGSYSGVVKPELHYIPLKKDYSNLDEVFAKLEDTVYLEAMTERAYRDIILSGAYSYRTFVQDTDGVLEAICRHPRHTHLYYAALFTMQDGKPVMAMPSMPAGLHQGPHALGYPLAVALQNKDGRVEITTNYTEPPPAAKRSVVILRVKRLVYRLLRPIWRMVPGGMRSFIVAVKDRCVAGISFVAAALRPQRIVERICMLLPETLRLRILRLAGK